jgi:hypothetical protein
MPERPEFVLHTIVLRLIPNGRCEGCGRVGRVDRRSILCGYCATLKLETEDRKHKLTGTLHTRFAFIAKKIRAQLKEFASPLQRTP